MAEVAQTKPARTHSPTGRCDGRAATTQPSPAAAHPAATAPAVSPRPSDPLASQLARCVQERSARRDVSGRERGAVTAPVLQRTLIAAGQPGAGRLPAEEKTSLKALLARNGYAGELYTKALWDPVHKEKLEDFFTMVTYLDAEVDNATSPKKKKRIKLRLADQYEGLLQQAQAAVQDTDDQYSDRVEAAGAILENWRKTTPGAKGFFKKQWPTFEGLTKTQRTGLTYVTDDKFMQNAISAAKRLQGGGQAPQGLSPQQKLAFDAEQAAVNTQLAAWRNVMWQEGQHVPGVNENGTWGTSAGGAGATFSITKVSPAVWEKLKKWWLRKKNAFVTASDTSTWSLKMSTDEDGRSPLMNYHINVG